MYLENRLIAMLDVLGMSNQIQNKSDLPNVLAKYARLIKEARPIKSRPTMKGSLEPEQKGFEIGEFVFDTLVIVSYPVDVKSTYNFISSIIQLMEIFAKENMPLRGAVGIGDYCADSDTKIFLSDVFKKLHNEEQNQDWTGCVLLPKDEDQILSDLIGAKSPCPNQADIMHYLSVPSKETVAKSKWCLNWSYLLVETELESILKYMEGSPTKHANTQEYINHLKSLPDESQKLPANYYPAVKLKLMKSRGGFRIQFLNASGIPVEPGCEVQLTVHK